MTPKEKAEKLLSEYLIFFPEFRNDLEYDYNIESAKTCALIPVDEIINSLGITTNHCELNKLDQQEVKNDFEYWQEVKQEIEKL